MEVFVVLGGRGGERNAGFSGTYEVFRDRVEFRDNPAVATTARWAFDGQTLTLTDMDGGCDDLTVWTSHPWVLVTPPDAPAEEPGA